MTWRRLACQKKGSRASGASASGDQSVPRTSSGMDVGRGGPLRLAPPAVKMLTMGEGTVDRLATSQQSMRCEKRKTIKSSNTNLRSRKVIVFLSRRLRNENIFAARISCAKIAIIFSSSL